MRRVIVHGKVGDRISAGERLFTIHADDEAKLQRQSSGCWGCQLERCAGRAAAIVFTVWSNDRSADKETKL